MATKKVMLWPSARTRYLKHDHMKTIRYFLYGLTILMAIQYYYLYAFIYGVKLLLMVLVSIVITKEVEILFYTHDKEITRAEAKTLIEKSYPAITAMIYALLIPVGTPLWLVGLGAALATLLGKLLFGGYHHMVFHSSLVGVIVVTLGWQQLVDSVAFMTSFDNYVLELLFDNTFFNDTIAIGGLFDPANLDSALMALSNGSAYSLSELVLGIVPGVVGSGIVLLGILVFLSVKKMVNWVLPVTMILSLMGTALLYAYFNGDDLTLPLYQLFAGSFLFIVVFVSIDPITTPIPRNGKLVFGVVAGSLTFFIRQAATYEEGVVFAVLFMMMLTPMLNELFKVKKKPKTAAPKKVGASS